MQLSPQQQAAVEHTGSPALVVAGAGSGKTRTLTAKFAHLVQSGILPEQILAITFTNKAADEMKSRLIHMTGLGLQRFPWVRTYHSACFQILKAHCHLLGYHTPLQVFTTYHQQKTVKDVLLGLNYDKKHAMGVLGQISNAKNSGHPRAYFDPHPLEERQLGQPVVERAPAEFLPWLANWVALSLREDWDEEEKRRFISRVVPLYRQRGTKAGLTEMLFTYTDDSRIEISEDPDRPHYFAVRLFLDVADPTLLARKQQIAKAIIDQEKPAHTYYDLTVHVSSTIQVAVRSTVGVNTLLGSPPASPAS